MGSQDVVPLSARHPGELVFVPRYPDDMPPEPVPVKSVGDLLVLSELFAKLPAVAGLYAGFERGRLVAAHVPDGTLREAKRAHRALVRYGIGHVVYRAEGGFVVLTDLLAQDADALRAAGHVLAYHAIRMRLLCDFEGLLPVPAAGGIVAAFNPGLDPDALN